MVRLHALVEGQTEESFINEVLAPELGVFSIFVDARCVATGRRRGKVQKGGAANYARVRRELVRWMKEDKGTDSWFTSMFDLFRLDNEFPGSIECMKHQDPLARVECLESKFEADIRDEFGNGSVGNRFIPHIQLHEFETLVFADPGALRSARPNHDEAINRLLEIKKAAGGAEFVNGGHETAPSKRLIGLIPDYAKSIDGVLTVKRIGVARLKSECPHFGAWIARLLKASGASN